MRVFNRASATRAPRAGIAALAALATFGSACASSGLGPDGFRHHGHGYSLPHPSDPPGTRWQVTEVDDAKVAYRSDGEAFMALDSRCNDEGAKPEDPAVLARQLLVGIANRTRIESDAFEFAGGRAYAQVVDSKDERGEVVRTRTVTLVRGHCVIDWVLVFETGEAGHPEIEASFEAWWRGFEPRFDLEPPPSEELAEVTP